MKKARQEEISCRLEIMSGLAERGLYGPVLGYGEQAGSFRKNISLGGVCLNLLR
jgi:hypothetical protein